MPDYREVTDEQIRSALPAELPAGMARIIRNYYQRQPLEFNTDWAGTMPMWGLTKWARRGLPGALDCVKTWFDAHLQRDPGLSDGEFLATYNGHRSQVIRGRYLPYTTYCGLYGLVFPLAELYLQTGDQRARVTCLEIADTLMYRARRNKFGLLAHDDNWVYDIPDAGFFACQALMLAAKVDAERGWPYVKHAAAQLRAYIDVFLDRKVGLAKTILGPEGLGKEYWCRAQGWLIWAMTAVLRDLPRTDAAFAGFRDDLEFFADGLAKVVDSDGAIHAMADKPETLAETTGTAMVALALHEAIRRGWLTKKKYGPLVERMWQFCKKHVTDDGSFEKVYYEWALPAELFVESSKTVQYGPHIGALLWLAEEITTD